MSQLSPEGSNPRDGHTLLVRRGRVESVDLYEIKDSELEQLEKGTQGDLHFNFAVFFISTALSFALALATAEFQNKKMETFFMLVTVVGGAGGIYQGVLWWKSKSAIKTLCATIKQRIAPEKTLVAAAQTITTTDLGAVTAVTETTVVAVEVVTEPNTPTGPTMPAG